MQNVPSNLLPDTFMMEGTIKRSEHDHDGEKLGVLQLHGRSRSTVSGMIQQKITGNCSGHG